VIQCTGADADENFIGANRWHGRIFVMENFCSAVMMEHDGFHGFRVLLRGGRKVKGRLEPQRLRRAAR
jgi:hypothetical protein